jgi:integrase
VPLLSATVEALQRHRDRKAAERLIAGERYTDQGVVFASADGAALRGDDVYKYDWLPTLKRLGLLVVRLYNARHTAATMLLEAGQPMKVVQEMLGHTSMPVMADTYLHVSPAFKRQAAEVLAAHLGRARSHVTE